jgi:alkanesulfonate monooxygenase SsuD/methylene tetrahydromethanopterin reductase-like flavin-dependent oxidoreductase (luciferase family)
VKVGLILPLFSDDPGGVVAFARKAEELGFDGVFAFDHLFPRGAPSDRASPEAFATLSGVAAATHRIEVGTLVTRASLRPFGLLAKMVASLDDISGGRMILGIGTGDQIDGPEHETYGLPYLGERERREHLVETVRALKSVFRGEARPAGHWVPAVVGPLLPPPTAPGGPPVWVGGRADDVVRIAAREADAWNGWGLSLPGFARKARVLREAAAGAGRAVEATWAGILVMGRDEHEASAMLNARREKGMVETDVWVGSVSSLIRWLDGLETAGASWAVLVPAGPPDRVDLIAEHVLPHMRSRP